MGGSAVLSFATCTVTGFSNLPQIAHKGRLLTNNKGKTISSFSILHFPIKHRLMTFLCSMHDNWFLCYRKGAQWRIKHNEEKHFFTFHFPFLHSPYPISSFLLGTCRPCLTILLYSMDQGHTVAI